MKATILALNEKAKPLGGWVADVLFPPRCSACGVITDAAHGFCSTCFDAIDFIAEPYCACCGLPFEYDLGGDALCAACMQERPPYAAARAAFHYHDASRSLITRFKYSDMTHALPAYVALLRRAAGGALDGCEVMIPVPLHRKRLIERRYNQAALLAYGLGKACQIPVLPDGLLRVRHTTPQAGLARNARLENVKGAFRVNHAHADYLRNKSVVLIDDVMTTGATIHACSKALMQAGVKRLVVLTLARSVRD